MVQKPGKFEQEQQEQGIMLHRVQSSIFTFVDAHFDCITLALFLCLLARTLVKNYCVFIVNGWTSLLLPFNKIIRVIVCQVTVSLKLG